MTGFPGRLLGALRHGADRGLHRLQRLGDVTQILGHLGVELAAKPLQGFRAPTLHLMHLALLAGELLGACGIFLQNFERAGHGADLVLPVAARDLGREIAGGEAAHRVGHRLHRPDDGTCGQRENPDHRGHR
jgi:hypothetical protein